MRKQAVGERRQPDLDVRELVPQLPREGLRAFEPGRLGRGTSGEHRPADVDDRRPPRRRHARSGSRSTDNDRLRRGGGEQNGRPATSGTTSRANPAAPGAKPQRARGLGDHGGARRSRTSDREHADETDERAERRDERDAHELLETATGGRRARHRSSGWRTASAAAAALLVPDRFSSFIASSRLNNASSYPGSRRTARRYWSIARRTKMDRCAGAFLASSSSSAPRRFAAMARRSRV